ncbi:hypothetical protein HYPSUDRAFT_201779 [Hypholoma sublateritium FD-334 SS-4]|uniref:Uncharacterized protein n=1 Tax=Hypholoma sublateritium (strain FD-334 SS-4) TaxID=945553 RepID=A0A0D2MH58_HYPSF|nr:hypothetical protein HYPSUDRAFT_201779 [Hypholoma sublateritium FD-334 SS-4]
MIAQTDPSRHKIESDWHTAIRPAPFSSAFPPAHTIGPSATFISRSRWLHARHSPVSSPAPRWLPDILPPDPRPFYAAR